MWLCCFVLFFDVLGVFQRFCFVVFVFVWSSKNHHNDWCFVVFCICFLCLVFSLIIKHLLNTQKNNMNLGQVSKQIRQNLNTPPKKTCKHQTQTLKTHMKKTTQKGEKQNHRNKKHQAKPPPWPPPWPPPRSHKRQEPSALLEAKCLGSEAHKDKTESWPKVKEVPSSVSLITKQRCAWYIPFVSF